VESWDKWKVLKLEQELESMNCEASRTSLYCRPLMYAEVYTLYTSASMTHRSKGLVHTVVSSLERGSLTTEHEKVDLLLFGHLSSKGDLDVDFFRQVLFFARNFRHDPLHMLVAIENGVLFAPERTYPEPRSQVKAR
jgi:hypothetical protein